MKIKRIWAALLASAMAVGCGACSSGSQPESSSSPAPSAPDNESSSEPAQQEASGEEIEIRFTWWGDTKPFTSFFY